MAEKIKIMKSYAQTITRDYHSWSFNTAIEREVEVASGEDLVKASTKLANTVKALTLEDVNKCLADGTISPLEVKK